MLLGMVGLMGCTTIPLTSSPVLTELVVRVIIIGEEANIDSVCRTLPAMVHTKEQIQGCSIFDGFVTLTMYIKPPKHVRDIQAFCVIGHELWHGVAGNFHKDIPAGC